MYRCALQLSVIVSFRHKGLKRLFEKDDAAGIRPDLLDKVRTILVQLDEAAAIEDMRLTSFHLHALKGDRKGFGPLLSVPTGELFSVLTMETPAMWN